MKNYKIRSDYDCLVKYEDGESFLDINTELNFSTPEKLLIYPLSQTNKNSFPFVVNLDSCESSRFFKIFKLKEFDLIYISAMPYVQNEIIETIVAKDNECKVYISEDYIAFEIDNQKKTIPLTKSFDDYSIKTIGNLLFLHLISKEETMWVFNLNNKSLRQFEGKKIELFENHLSVAKDVKDIANHVIYQTFEINNDEIITKKDSLKYNLQEPVIVTNPSIIPIAFLEAVKIEDFDLARRYLDNDLAKVTSDEHLKNYFKNIIKIIPFNNGLIGVMTQDDFKLFNFEIKNAKIVEINED